VIAIVPERFDTGGPTPCGYIRLLQPLTHPAIAGDCDIILADAKSVLDYDVDIIATHRYAIPDIRAADLLHQHARRSGARLLYDLDDDLLRIAPTHPEAAELRPLAKVVRRMLAHADTVWVSTPYLADALRSTRRDTVIMPNGLDERLWTGPVLPRRAEHTPIRILCMGTTTHIRDFALIAPALTRIKKEFGSAVEIDVIGMTAGDSFPEGVNRLGLPNAATQSYPGFVNWMNSQLPGWDVGLTPLLETPFNLSKSYIKTMDYAALGMAVLASDMPVYRGSLADGPAGRLVANDPRAWYAELNWLVRNPALVRTMAAAARPAFLGRATLASQGEARRTALLDLLRQPQPAACAADAAG
jgi:glycosyltransferase involved in cell wall biosynthesis